MAVSCGSNGHMSIDLNHQVTSYYGNEAVWARVDLFEWRQGAWRRDLMGELTYQNVAFGSGLIYGPWWTASNPTAYTTYFTINRPGYYRVAVQYWWQFGARSYEWAGKHTVPPSWDSWGMSGPSADWCTYGNPAGARAASKCAAKLRPKRTACAKRPMSTMRP